MEPARNLDRPRRWDSPSFVAPKSPEPGRMFADSGRVNQTRDIMFGKIVFYLTVMTPPWFFYWLNGIQCPC
jgi:hypothetical protein